MELYKRASIFDLTLDEMSSQMTELQSPTFRAQQVWDWVYCKGAKDFNSMSNLPITFRDLISERYSIYYPEATSQMVARDEVVKWLLKMRDGHEIETVFIPEDSRGTLCISSQIGCTLNCTFCHTGTQKLVRNLTAGEIVGQVLYAKRELELMSSAKDIAFSLYADRRSEESKCSKIYSEQEQHPTNLNGKCYIYPKRLTNIVLMGMGEPLLNYENVSVAIKNLMHKKGLNISRNKITLSTSGIIPMMAECASDLGVNLAVSLHATYDDLRNTLVPINKKYGITALMEACREYASLTKDKRITFEYVMLDGVNDSIKEAEQLVKLLEKIPSKVNLIPFNPWPGTIYKVSPAAQIKKFARVLEAAGYQSPIRKTRGQDIMAACGQLKSSSVRQPANKQSFL